VSNYVGSSNGFWIGADSCCSEGLVGFVDEVKVYNRALTADEIAAEAVAVDVINSTTANSSFIVAPGATVGARNVTVTTPGGTSSPVPFTVTTPSTGFLVSPNTGSIAGGTRVLITGTNFSSPNV